MVAGGRSASAARDSLRPMDELLKLSADAGVEVSAAETALEDEMPQAARDALDRADDLLAQLRERWPEMSAAERAVIGNAASAIRRRRDAVAARVPVRRVLSDAAAEVDPEQDEDPEGAA
jgi:hypothetical protein